MDFIRWTTSFSPDANFTFNVWSNLKYTLRGHARLFFGGRFNLIKGLLNPFTAMLIVILVTLLPILGWKLLRTFRELNFRNVQILNFDPHSKPLALLCAVWSFMYLAFLFFWLPHHTDYRLFYLPALILLGGLALSTYKTGEVAKPKYRAALLVGIIFISNFLFPIFPYSHAEKYAPLSLALEMNGIWRRGTVVYYAASNADNALFKYFNPAATWKQIKSAEEQVPETELQEIYNRSGTAWIEASAIDRISSTPGGAEWLTVHAREQSRREVNDPAYKIKFVQIVPRADELQTSYPNR